MDFQIKEFFGIIFSSSFLRNLKFSSSSFDGFKVEEKFSFLFF